MTLYKKLNSFSGCLPSLGRVFSNKVAVLKMLALIFLHTCIENFDNFKDKYLESIFHITLPSDLFQDTWISRVTTGKIFSPSLISLNNLLGTLWLHFFWMFCAGLLEPLVVCMSVLLSALVVAWKKPRASSLAWWGGGVAFLCGIVAMGHLQLTCHNLSIMGEQVGKVANFHTSGCECSQDQDFWPVCMGFPPHTFYSPCHAGCKNYSAGVRTRSLRPTHKGSKSQKSCQNMKAKYYSFEMYF